MWSAGGVVDRQSVMYSKDIDQLQVLKHLCIKLYTFDFIDGFYRFHPDVWLDVI